MDSSRFSRHYRSGEEIRPGDRVSWAGSPAKVVFVLGMPGVPHGWQDMPNWINPPSCEGFMLDTESAGWVFETEADEDLEFFGREPPLPETGPH